VLERVLDDDGASLACDRDRAVGASESTTNS
jgi:hypothetical protein